MGPLQRRTTLKLMLLGLVLPFAAFASGDHGKGEKEHEGEEHKEEAEEASPGVGPNKAITEADHEKGFKLSPEATKTLAIKSAPATHLTSGGGIVPKSALAFFQGEVGVYRLRDGWYKLVEVTLTPKTSSIKTNEFKANDQIVVEGVPLLRIADLDASGGNEEGHGH